MWMGTKLSHLQECRRRLGWEAPKTSPTKYQRHPNTRYTAAEFLPDPKGTTTSDSGISVPSDPKLQGATKLPMYLDSIIGCTGQICGANPSKKRMGREDGKTQ